MRSRIKNLQSDLEKTQKDKLHNNTDLQVARSDLDRLTLITNHLKEEKQIASQEITFLKTLNEEYLIQVNSLNQFLSNERLEKSNLSNLLSSQESELKILRNQVEDLKFRENSNQLKSDEKFTTFQNRYELEVNSLRTLNNELELKVNEREVLRKDYENEFTTKLEALKLQYEQQLNEMTLNTSDTRRNCTNLTFELNSNKRELERLKDNIKAREAKIDQQQERLKRTQQLDEKVEQLIIQLSQKENALASALSKYKQLQSSLSSYAQNNNIDQVKMKEENEKLTRKNEELELEIKSFNEKFRVSSLQMEDLLLKEQNSNPMSDRQKMDYLTKMKKENMELKQENSKLKEVARINQMKLRQKPTSSIAQIKQNLPPT